MTPHLSRRRRHSVWRRRPARRRDGSTASFGRAIGTTSKTASDRGGEGGRAPRMPSPHALMVEIYDPFWGLANPWISMSLSMSMPMSPPTQESTPLPSRSPSVTSPRDTTPQPAVTIEPSTSYANSSNISISVGPIEVLEASLISITVTLIASSIAIIIFYRRKYLENEYSRPLTRSESSIKGAQSGGPFQKMKTRQCGNLVSGPEFMPALPEDSGSAEEGPTGDDVRESDGPEGGVGRAVISIGTLDIKGRDGADDRQSNASSQVSVQCVEELSAGVIEMDNHPDDADSSTDATFNANETVSALRKLSGVPDKSAKRAIFAIGTLDIKGHDVTDNRRPNELNQVSEGTVKESVVERDDRPDDANQTAGVAPRKLSGDVDKPSKGEIERPRTDEGTVISISTLDTQGHDCTDERQSNASDQVSGKSVEEMFKDAIEMGNCPDGTEAPTNAAGGINETAGVASKKLTGDADKSAKGEIERARTDEESIISTGTLNIQGHDGTDDRQSNASSQVSGQCVEEMAAGAIKRADRPDDTNAPKDVVGGINETAGVAPRKLAGGTDKPAKGEIERPRTGEGTIISIGTLGLQDHDGTDDRQSNASSQVSGQSVEEMSVGAVKRANRPDDSDAPTDAAGDLNETSGVSPRKLTGDAEKPAKGEIERPRTGEGTIISIDTLGIQGHDGTDDCQPNALSQVSGQSVEGMSESAIERDNLSDDTDLPTDDAGDINEMTGVAPGNLAGDAGKPAKWEIERPRADEGTIISIGTLGLQDHDGTDDRESNASNQVSGQSANEMLVGVVERDNRPDDSDAPADDAGGVNETAGVAPQKLTGDMDKPAKGEIERPRTGEGTIISINTLGIQGHDVAGDCQPNEPSQVAGRSVEEMPAGGTEGDNLTDDTDLPTDAAGSINEMTCVAPRKLTGNADKPAKGDIKSPSSDERTIISIGTFGIQENDGTNDRQSNASSQVSGQFVEESSAGSIERDKLSDDNLPTDAAGDINEMAGVAPRKLAGDADKPAKGEIKRPRADKGTIISIGTLGIQDHDGTDDRQSNSSNQVSGQSVEEMAAGAFERDYLSDDTDLPTDAAGIVNETAGVAPRKLTGDADKLAKREIESPRTGEGRDEFGEGARSDFEKHELHSSGNFGAAGDGARAGSPAPPSKERGQSRWSWRQSGRGWSREIRN